MGKHFFNLHRCQFPRWVVESAMQIYFTAYDHVLSFAVKSGCWHLGRHRINGFMLASDFFWLAVIWPWSGIAKRKLVVMSSMVCPPFFIKNLSLTILNDVLSALHWSWNYSWVGPFVCCIDASSGRRLMSTLSTYGNCNIENNIIIVIDQRSKCPIAFDVSLAALAQTLRKARDQIFLMTSLTECHDYLALLCTFKSFQHV